ncbi:MAG: hypothetical protein ACE5PT_14905, partial [Gemmatimonadales bacterium]
MLRQRVPWVACLLVLFGAATAPPIDTAQAQVSPKIEGFPDTTGLIDRFGPGFENYVRRRIQRSGMSPQQIRLQL